LQPTNARPRNLIFLYEGLKEIGWYNADERIEFVSSRWYLSSSFTKRMQPDHPEFDSLPGAKLFQTLMSSDRSDGQCQSPFQSYLIHHCKWLNQDFKIAGQLHGGEDQWLAAFHPYVQSMQANLEK